MKLTEWEIFQELTNWEIVGVIFVVVVFLFLLIKTFWVLFTFWRDNDD